VKPAEKLEFGHLKLACTSAKFSFLKPESGNFIQNQQDFIHM
jgi:hypothetical protein